MRFCVEIYMPNNVIISIIISSLATNPIFGVLKTIQKIIQWVKARKYKVNTNIDVENNIWQKRSNISVTTKIE